MSRSAGRAAASAGPSSREPRHNHRMIRPKTLSASGFALLVLGVLTTGCASTVTVVPGKSLALLEVTYPESRMTGVVLATSGETTPMARMGEAIVRELSRDGVYAVADARAQGVHASDLGKDAAKTAALRQAVPADAYVAVKLLDCAARPITETERRGTGASAVEVTVYLFRGECTAELTAFDPDGKTLAVVQKTGRWDSPRQDRPDGSAMQSQAMSNGIDDVARRIARDVRPTAGK